MEVGNFKKQLMLTTVQMCVLVGFTFAALYLLTHTYLKHEEIPAMAMIISGLFFVVYDVSAMAVHHFLEKNAPNIVTGFYLAGKALRFFFAIAIVVLYGALEGPQVVAFIINFFAFYVVTLIFITIHFVRSEKKNKKTHE